MADLLNYTVFENTKYKILTDEGFKDFTGIIIGENNKKVKISFNNGNDLICTHLHKLVLNDKGYKYAKDIQVGDYIFSNIRVVKKEELENNDAVFEILNVADNHRYYVNGVLCSQCLLLDEGAFIPAEFMDAFWESVYPVISSSKKSKIFMFSTPNGVGNLFYRIYTNAVQDQKNEWHRERIDWWEVPGRDEKWKEDTLKALGSQEAFDQEFGNVFRAAGETALDKEQLEELKSKVVDPILTDEDGNYRIFKDRQPFHFYTIGVDTGEGIGRANSVIQVVDITDLTNIEQVAVYANNKLDPYNFAAKLLDIAREWGSPPLMIERNNCGAQVLDALVHTHNYESIVKYTPSMGNFTEKVEREHRLGIFSHTNSKFNSMSNFRYWVNILRCVTIYDKYTLDEFSTYIRQQNGVWKKQSDKYLDDRIEAFIWAIFVLDGKVVEQYYEVIERDGNGKVLKVRPFNFDPYEENVPKLEQVYERIEANTKGKTSREQISVRTPTFLPTKPGSNAEMDELLADGWKPLHSFDPNQYNIGSDPGPRW